MTSPIAQTVKAVLTGTAPLVMHNPRLADPDDPYTVAIAEISRKRTDQTAEDRERKGDLQWLGSLYTDPPLMPGTAYGDCHLVVPTIWILRALETGGTTLGKGTASKGKAVIRSVTLTEPEVPLDYAGPDTIETLSKDRRFRWRALVNPTPTRGKGGRLPTVRPIFREWSATTRLHVVSDMGLSWDDFERAFRAAGNEGIGDARKLTYGRFHAKLTKLH